MTHTARPLPPGGQQAPGDQGEDVVDDQVRRVVVQGALRRPEHREVLVDERAHRQRLGVLLLDDLRQVDAVLEHRPVADLPGADLRQVVDIVAGGHEADPVSPGGELVEDAEGRADVPVPAGDGEKNVAWSHHDSPDRAR
ncbi:hypothetical protein ACFQY7_13110 [Actinomadura luteofluorescens]|uniref:hypothetical protein n=1 Tax=Actinomadura luteofluorescens TaxID=46163 RepID=UPI003631AD45